MSNTDSQSIQALVQNDYLDNEIDQVKVRGRLSQEEPCLNIHCSTKTKNEKLKQKDRLNKNEIQRLQKEVETLKSVLKGELEEAEKSEALNNVLRSSEIEAQNKVITELRERAEILQSTLDQERTSNHKIQEEHELIMSSFKADATIQKKLSEIRVLEHEISLLQNKKAKTETEISRADIQFSRLASAHNQVLEEYNELTLKVKALKKELNSSAKFKMIGTDKKHVRRSRGLLARIFPFLR